MSALLATVAREAALDPDEERGFRESVRHGFALAFERRHDVASGSTKSGGEPDLAPGVSWPMHPADPGAPLYFLMQIDLATLPSSPARSELSNDGLLSFFVDRLGYTLGLPFAPLHGCRVLHMPRGAPLVRAKRPPPVLDRYPPAARQLYEAHAAYPEWPSCAITMRDVVTLPGPTTIEYERLVTEHGLSHSQLDALRDGLWRHQEIPAWQGSWLLGHSQNMNDVESDLRASGAKTESWVPLAQVYSDQAAGLSFSGNQWERFWIPTSDLTRRDFSRVRAGIGY